MNVSTTEAPERVLLVGLCRSGRNQEQTEADLAELARLTDTAGGVVVGQIWQERERLDPATLIGKGKAEEVGRAVKRLSADTVVFDDELSPAQIRNLERLTEVKVIDRSAIILDIFARRARTREAKIQVELAQMEYLLPRLTRRWTHLSRQAGASGSLGLKGVGETQLELDRRLIRRKIARLKVDLDRIEKGRVVRRTEREGIFKVALVGYTNAGKSTLFNALGDQEVFVEDRLFATLDPTVRRCQTPAGDLFLLIDTVGFLRKLPVDLVASFRSTLEETASADLLVHVVDLSHPHYEAQMETTHLVLGELGLLERPRLLVFNKEDAVPEEGIVDRAKALHPEALVISARANGGVGSRGHGIVSSPGNGVALRAGAASRMNDSPARREVDRSPARGEVTHSPARREFNHIAARREGGSERVREAIADTIAGFHVTARVAAPASRGDVVGRIHGLARILDRTLDGERIVFTLRVDRSGLQKILGLSDVQELPA